MALNGKYILRASETAKKTRAVLPGFILGYT